MNYLLDKKVKRIKFFKAVSFVVFCVILLYFQANIFDALAYASQVIFRPVLIAGHGLGEKFGNLGSYFVYKNSLYLENENLKTKLAQEEALMANYNSVLSENTDLKEVLGRKNGKNLVLSAILEKPNQSLYDTLVIDIGKNNGVITGDMVWGWGNVPLGQVSDVYPHSSKVILFSTNGEKTEVLIGNKNVFTEIVGRGGSNFEMIMPRDFILVKGDQAILPGVTPHVLATVETIISDPRDSFQKALLVSPVNMEELKFVEVEMK